MTTTRAAAAAVGLGLGLSALAGCGHGRGRAADDPMGDAEALADDAAREPPPTSRADAGEQDAPEETETGSLVAEAAPPTQGCATGADLIYVASEERNLYAFDPATVSFTLLGNIDCAQGTYVNSMAIDRSAQAWINYGDGSLWKADTRHPACTATGFLPNQQGVGLFGMGFAARSAGAPDDRLFIDDLSGGGLGYIDLGTMMLMRFGPFAGSLVNQDCELTGTSGARLFGFFAGSPFADAGGASVVALDPASEAALAQWPLTGVDTGSDWAFAAWGGDFYLFTADKYDMIDPFTTVTRLRPGDGSVTVLAKNIGLRVVGAGSSTCAPAAPAQ